MQGSHCVFDAGNIYNSPADVYGTRQESIEIEKETAFLYHEEEDCNIQDIVKNLFIGRRSTLNHCRQQLPMKFVTVRLWKA